MRYEKEHPDDKDFDITKATVFANDDFRDEFSYATEHVSYDALIDVLNQSIKAFEYIKTIPGILAPETCDTCIAWCRDRLAEVWEQRGAFPGLGAMLCAFGFKHGLQIAENARHALKEDCSQSEFWAEVDAKIKGDVRAADFRNEWFRLSDERRALFQLLARFAFSPDKNVYFSGGGKNIVRKSVPEILFHENFRQQKGIALTDADILKNPYALYEATRLLEKEMCVSIKKVDMAVFPVENIAERFPLPVPSRVDSPKAQRRIRALAVSVLEELANEGHTFYPQSLLVEKLNSLNSERPCPVTGDTLSSSKLREFFSEQIVCFGCEKEGQPEAAFQLARLREFDEIIKASIRKRTGENAQRHIVNEDWNAILTEKFKNETNDEAEERAHTEKVAVLEELAAARLSVLIGGAGTGKTTLLALLCGAAKIRNGGILLLAPTGKARVRMQEAIQKHNTGANPTALTVAQFLLKSKRYNIFSNRYSLSDTPAKDVPQTVIIDESSMLTTEMFGALLQALQRAQRIVFVGDPNQLPPIGAGKPFVDLVNYLKPDNSTGLFPKVGKSYGELTIGRRQRQNDKSTPRFDAEFASIFARDNENKLDEDLFAKLQGNCDENIVFKQWKDNAELNDLILETVAAEAEMNAVDDVTGFQLSLGGTFSKDYCHVSIGAAGKVEDWQILAPVKGMPHGVSNINHQIHTKYCGDRLELAKTKQYKIPKPLGSEQIVYGDKVINVINKGRKGYDWTTKNPFDKATGYVANGEIGIFSAKWGCPKFPKVEFASQPQKTFDYSSSEFSDEGSAPLELAYALTVHKAQGSQFKRVILVLAEPCRLLSTELLYTALTRQSERVTILYNADAYKLRNYSLPSFSDIARRFSCLFEECPKVTEFKKHWFDGNLIHKTCRGELVRSKSEVIIADHLHAKGIQYEYEKELTIAGEKKLPDFTITDAESGRVIYWEHLGMLGDPVYKRRWEEKKAWYAQNGILEKTTESPTGGKNGLLVVTEDGPDGGIDSQKIGKLIEEIL